MKQLRSLTEGSLFKGIFWFSLPLVFSNLLQVLFNMSDIAVVGRFAGADALGSVGSTSTLVALFTGFLMGIGSGVNVIVARFYGARQPDEVEKTVHTAALLCLAAGLAVMAFGLVFTRPLLELLNTKEELLSGAALYLRIYFLGMPALALYNFGNGVLSAVGDTRRPLCFLTISGVVNVLLNLFFVIICRLSVAGVAIASVISLYISAVLVLLSLAGSVEEYGLRWKKLRINRDRAHMLLSIGLPAGVQNAIFQIANLFIQTGVNSFDATVVSGNAAATNADALVYDVMAAFYTACSSFMSQNLGAEKQERVKKSYFISLGYSFGAGALLGAGLVLCGRVFLSLFTTETAVAAAGMERLTVMGFSYCVSAFMDCTIAASRGLGKSFVPTVIVILGSCVFRVIWVYTVFAYFHTIQSLYLLYVFSWSITSLAEIVYFIRCYQKTFPKLPAAA